MKKQDEFYLKLEQLEKELWFLVKHKLPELKQEILDKIGNIEDVGNLKNQVASLEQSVENLSKDFSSLGSTIETMQNDLTGVSQKVDSSSAAVTQLGEDLGACKDDVTALSERIDGTDKTLSDLGKQVSTLDDGLKATSEELNRTNSTLTTLRSRVVDVENDNANIKQDISDIQTSIADCSIEIGALTESVKANKDEIDALDKSVQSAEEGVRLNSTEINSINSKLSVMTSRIVGVENGVQSAQSGVSANAEKIESNSSSIAQNTQAIESLVGQVQQLSQKGRKIETFFDMNSDDPDINQGFTTGAIGGKMIYWQNDYDFLRVYATMSNVSGYIEVPIDKSKQTDFVLKSISSTGKDLHFFRNMIFPQYKRITLGRAITYTFNSSAGTFSMTNSVKDDYYISRVDGIKED